MNIEEIKALYAQRDAAFSVLQSWNIQLESDVDFPVSRLAEKVVVAQSGSSTFWNGCRLQDLVKFDPETEIFTILIETYQGEGRWEVEFDEDGDEDRLCVRIPARWLSMDWAEVSAEISEKKAKKKAEELALRDAKTAQAVREMEARDRAELARLSAKYQPEGIKS